MNETYEQRVELRNEVARDLAGLPIDFKVGDLPMIASALIEAGYRKWEGGAA